MYLGRGRSSSAKQRDVGEEKKERKHSEMYSVMTSISYKNNHQCEDKVAQNLHRDRIIFLNSIIKRLNNRKRNPDYINI